MVANGTLPPFSSTLTNASCTGSFKWNTKLVALPIDTISPPFLRNSSNFGIDFSAVNCPNILLYSAGISFAYDLPATLDYNIGFKSTNENDKKFGGYFGVGFGYFKVSVSGSQYSDFKGAAYGPLFRSGIRFFLPKDNTALTVGMYYKKGLEKSRLNTIGFNVLYDL